MNLIGIVRDLIPDSTIRARFEAKYVGEPNSGCWLWDAGADKHGYGRFGIGSKVFLATRVSWTLNRGPIPDGLHVLHKCDTPACVNPDHLFLGTHLDNVRDCRAKGRNYGAPEIRRAKTHCVSGHSYSGNNLRLSRGKRYCRECDRLRYLQKKAAKQ